VSPIIEFNQHSNMDRKQANNESYNAGDQDARDTRDSFLRSLFSPRRQSESDEQNQTATSDRSHSPARGGFPSLPRVPQMHLAEPIMVPLHALPPDQMHQHYPNASSFSPRSFQNDQSFYGVQYNQNPYQAYPCTDLDNQGYGIATPSPINKRRSALENETSHKRFFPRFGGGETELGPQPQKQQVDHPEIICNCIKSRCLKLYCDCFQAGSLCNTFCRCKQCLNVESESFQGGRLYHAKKEYMVRKPDSFGKKEKKAGQGCSCRNNKCLKKYCDCFRSEISCSDKCSCVSCANVSAATKGGKA